MVSEPKLASLEIMTSSSNLNKEPTLRIQDFHQCSSLILVKLRTSNLLLWYSKVAPLIRSLGMYHHLTSSEKSEEEIEDDESKISPNPLYQPWINNDGLLSLWLLGTMKKEFMSLIYYEADTMYKILDFHWRAITRCNCGEKGLFEKYAHEYKKRNKIPWWAIEEDIIWIEISTPCLIWSTLPIFTLPWFLLQSRFFFVHLPHQYYYYSIRGWYSSCNQ